MKRSMILALALGMFAPVALIGCGGEETKEKTTVETKTPTGSTTETTEKKVEATGDQKPVEAPK